jgi:uncharacterized membrane protein YciS (DUF1049 family)
VIALVVFLLVALVTLGAALFLLGFQLGGEHWQARLLRVRLESERAQRQMHDLTRQAFVAMSQRAEQSRRRSRGF